MWSDPSPLYGWNPSNRGVSFTYGEDVSETFLIQNSLKYIIRGHELAMQVRVARSPDALGFASCHRNKVITVFSAPNYCYYVGNYGGYIEVDEIAYLLLYSFFSGFIYSHQFVSNFVIPYDPFARFNQDECVEQSNTVQDNTSSQTQEQVNHTDSNSFSAQNQSSDSNNFS